MVETATSPSGDSDKGKSKDGTKGNKNVPWQMEWKHPQLITSTTEETRKDDDDSLVVGITSAMLSETETLQILGNSDLKQADRHYLLTVTLLGNPSNPAESTKPLASEVLLEVVHVPDSNPSKTNVIRSKRLRWPESIFDQTTKMRKSTARKSKKRKNLLDKIFLPLMGIDEGDEYGTNVQRSQKQLATTTASSSIGIVSATLCRRPQDELLAKTTATKDIVELMSFGNVGNEIDKVEQDNSFATDISQNGKNSWGELSFVCVSQAGEVFVYNPIHLLLGASDKTQDNVSNFFFGQELVQNLQETWKPLAEPTTRIHLSIFEYDKKQKKYSNAVQSKQKPIEMADSIHSKENQSIASSTKEQLMVSDDASTIATSATDALTVVQSMAVELQTNVDEALSMLPYLLNPLLEPATLKDRTVHNKPHDIAVSGSNYIVIIGSGSKRKYTKQNWDNASRVSNPPTVTSKSPQRPEKEEEASQDTNISNQASETKNTEKASWWEEDRAAGVAKDSNERNEQNVKIGHEEPSGPINNADDSNDESKETADGVETKIEEASEQGMGNDSDGEAEDSTNDKASENFSTKSAPTKDDDEENSQRHYFDGYDTTSAVGDTQDRGGFVTFLSTVRWSETRTLFLPFVPVRTSHIAQWNGMELLWVIGEFETLLIRMDSTGPVPVRIQDILTRDSFQTVTMSNRTNSTADGLELSPLSVKRFQVLPIDLGATASISPRLLCASHTSIDPPSILELHVDLDSEKEISSEKERDTEALILQKTLGYCTPQGTVVLRHAPSNVAKIMMNRDETTAIVDGLIIAEHGQGWSLVGSNGRVHFICWEGSTLLQGAYVEELLHPRESTPIEPLLTNHILPLLATQDASLEISNSEVIERDSDFDPVTELPFIDELQRPISPIPNIDGDLPIDIFSPPSKTEKFSRRQNYEYLLRRCSSWTQLEDTSSNRIFLERQEPVLCLRGGKSGLPPRMLSLRQLVVDNGKSSPFQQVLAWLAKRKNFFVAAGIALDLLKDGDTLYHLWKHAEMIDEEDEETKLFGLLDGISPVRLLDENQTANQHKHSVTATHLSDMTVGCFIKGGASMAKTLERFLEYNESYDPQKVSLMLSLATIDLFSNNNFDMNAREEELFGELLWPIKCLLSVGTEREYLHEVLTMLNHTIPDELRHRHSEEEKDEEKTATISLGLTKTLIKLILESDNEALEILMGFVDDRSGTTFWQSLDHPTRLALSMMCVDGSFPFLRHPDVRAWAREKLNMCFQGKSELPSSWLQEVSFACLQNASCNPDDLRVVESINDSDVEKMKTTNTDDPVKRMKIQIEKTRSGLLPSKNARYAIDYDLLIPALLLLEVRNSHWLSPLQLSTFSATQELYVSTQCLLNAACHLVGRTSVGTEEQFLLVGFDEKAAMKQCFQANNVVAGAYLIGGKNGFLLHVCDVLHQGIGMSIADAESFLSMDRLDLSVVNESKPVFELTVVHQKLLLLLEEHVLGIKTFGDFDFAHNRGTVDPVFCARSVLRAWLSLSLDDRASASRWLGDWLEDRLGIKNVVGSGDTPRSTNKAEGERSEPNSKDVAPNLHRLACASLVRSLLWPNNRATPTTKEANHAFGDEALVIDDNVPLACTMEFEKTLLIELCQSCLGLVESVPPAVVREIQI